MLQNRRKKTSWIAEQQANYDRALALAREAEANGTLTDDLRMFLIKEQAIEQAEEEQKNRGSIFSRAKNALYSGFTKEETAGGTLAAALTKEDMKRRMSNEDAARLAPASGQAASDVLEPVPPRSVTDSLSRRSEDPAQVYNRTSPLPAGSAMRTTPLQRRGGYLDQLADNAASSILTSARGWTSFGKSS